MKHCKSWDYHGISQPSTQDKSQPSTGYLSSLALPGKCLKDPGQFRVTSPSINVSIARRRPKVVKTWQWRCTWALECLGSWSPRVVPWGSLGAPWSLESHCHHGVHHKMCWWTMVNSWCWGKTPANWGLKLYLWHMFFEVVLVVFQGSMSVSSLGPNMK